MSCIECNKVSAVLERMPGMYMDQQHEPVLVVVERVPEIYKDQIIMPGQIVLQLTPRRTIKRLYGLARSIHKG